MHREVKFLASESQQAWGWGRADSSPGDWLEPTCCSLGFTALSLKFTEDWSAAPPGNWKGPLWLWNTMKEEKVLQQTELPRIMLTSICSTCRYYHSPLVPLLPHHHHHCSLLTSQHHHHHHQYSSLILPTTTTAPELPIKGPGWTQGSEFWPPLYLAPRVFWQSIESVCFRMVFVDSSWQLNFLLNSSGNELKKYDGLLKSYFNISSPIERAK